ncbi:MAG: molybdopterin dinucleotide binding domain-containing protein [Bryobacteraceae bacterium]
MHPSSLSNRRLSRARRFVFNQPLSSGTGFLEERRQHELDLRQPGRCRPADRDCRTARRRCGGSRYSFRRCVHLFNDRGGCVLTAQVGRTVAPGVVRVPSVRWGKRSPNGTGINVLTSQRLTDAGGGRRSTAVWYK